MTGLDGFEAPYEIRDNRDTQNVLTRVLEETEKIDQAVSLDEAQEVARDVVRELRRLRSALNY